MGRYEIELVGHRPQQANRVYPHTLGYRATFGNMSSVSKRFREHDLHEIAIAKVRTRTTVCRRRRKRKTMNLVRVTTVRHLNLSYNRGHAGDIVPQEKIRIKI